MKYKRIFRTLGLILLLIVLFIGGLSLYVVVKNAIYRKNIRAEVVRVISCVNTPGCTEALPEGAERLMGLTVDQIESIWDSSPYKIIVYTSTSKCYMFKSLPPIDSSRTMRFDLVCAGRYSDESKGVIEWDDEEGDCY